jgi:hypothetical protein
MKKALVLVLTFLSCSMLFAQQGGLKQSQLDEIKSALQRIAMSNNAVEQIIYDGMTFEEVKKILNVRELGIQNTSFDGYRTIVYVSYVGKYILYWSGLEYSNPIVLGYSLRGSTVIRHNALE